MGEIWEFWSFLKIFLRKGWDSRKPSKVINFVIHQTSFFLKKHEKTALSQIFDKIGNDQI